MSGTNFNATRHGLHKMTLEGRENGVVGDGVNEKGEKNTVVAKVQPYWEVVRSLALVEPIIYNAGFWKLRPVSYTHLDVYKRQVRSPPPRWCLASLATPRGRYL